MYCNLIVYNCMGLPYLSYPPKNHEKNKHFLLLSIMIPLINVSQFYSLLLNNISSSYCWFYYKITDQLYIFIRIFTVGTVLKYIVVLITNTSWSRKFSNITHNSIYIILWKYLCEILTGQVLIPNMPFTPSRTCLIILKNPLWVLIVLCMCINISFGDTVEA